MTTCPTCGSPEFATEPDPLLATLATALGTQPTPPTSTPVIALNDDAALIARVLGH